MDDAIYDRIKARLLAQALPTGQLLQITTLADELKVSPTPVREALTRLAAERLVTFVSRKGFFTKTPSEEEIRGLYSVNQMLLHSIARKDIRRGIERECVEQSPQRSRSLQRRDAQHLALGVSELFIDMALQSGVSEVANIVRNINDRLHQTRLVECKIVADVFDEFSKMCGLYESGKYEEVKQAIRLYHDKRLRLAGEICKDLHFRPFASLER